MCVSVRVQLESWSLHVPFLFCVNSFRMILGGKIEKHVWPVSFLIFLDNVDIYFMLQSAGRRSNPPPRSLAGLPTFRSSLLAQTSSFRGQGHRRPVALGPARTLGHPGQPRGLQPLTTRGIGGVCNPAVAPQVRLETRRMSPVRKHSDKKGEGVSYCP